MKKINNQTYLLSNTYIKTTSSIVGPKEKDGPLHQFFDQCLEDEFWGEKSWEKAESMLFTKATEKSLTKSNLAPGDVNFIVAGDLLNQCTASSFGLRELGVPYLGIYGACSTMAESMSIELNNKIFKLYFFTIGSCRLLLFFKA